MAGTKQFLCSQVQLSLYGPNAALESVVSCSETSTPVLHELLRESINLISQLGKKVGFYTFELLCSYRTLSLLPKFTDVL